MGQPYVIKNPRRQQLILDIELARSALNNKLGGLVVAKSLATREHFMLKYISSMQPHCVGLVKGLLLLMLTTPRFDKFSLTTSLFSKSSLNLSE